MTKLHLARDCRFCRLPVIPGRMLCQDCIDLMEEGEEMKVSDEVVALVTAQLEAAERERLRAGTDRIWRAMEADARSFRNLGQRAWDRV